MNTDFPILIGYGKNRVDIGIKTLPWKFVETATKRIEYNHSQTLERLAQRGGLDWYEILCGLKDERLRFSGPIDRLACANEVMRLFKEWEEKQTH